MYAGFSEEPKEIRCLAPVDVRYEYSIPLPQSCRFINQGNCQSDVICCPKIIICLGTFHLRSKISTELCNFILSPFLKQNALHMCGT